MLLAWYELSSCRSYGMVPGPIPWTAIDSYARRYFLDDDEFDMFRHVMMRVDSRWLLHVRSKGKGSDSDGMDEVEDDG